MAARLSIAHADAHTPTDAHDDAHRGAHAPTSAPTAQVLDLAGRATTDLPTSSVHIHGRTIRVKVRASLLPSPWPSDE